MIIHLKPLVPEQLIRQLAALIETHEPILSQQAAGLAAGSPK
jgi:hypothetical protein